MINKDSHLLQEAYLSVAQPKKPVIPSDEEEVTTEPNEIVSAGPVDEPAPGVEVSMVEPQSEPSVPGASVEMTPELAPAGEEMSSESEQEEHEMALDNLNSIRESIMKVASFCGAGGHLEPWQQQKLAIAMDNLAGVARSLSSGSRC